MLRTLLTVFVFLMTASGLFAQNVVNITDADINGDVTWTANNTYVLDGFVFVEDGESLTIEPGTVIKGKPGQAENATALIVARGGKIFANGTPANPIIFTAEADQLNGNLPLDTRGLWGGVILLGKATINTATGEGQIEGIPSTEPRGAYGGNDDEDDSGVFRYVSIRYGGTNIGEGNEINGLTMAAVGSKTRIEYVEVFNNADDGFEWFGGTANCKYLVSAFNGDDAFDYDEGFRGNGQFWFVIQSDEVGNRGAEQDGGTTPEDGMPYAMPNIYNVTYIGSGMDSENVDNDLAMIFRDNAGGKYYNSIFTEFAGSGIEVEDLASGEDSRARLEAGELVLNTNLWWNFGAGSAITDIATQDFVQTHLGANNNSIADPMLRGISRTNDMGLDPRPGSGSPALTGAMDPPDDVFFTKVTYLGAFGPSDLWIYGWTAISDYGIVAEPQSEIVQITDEDIDGSVTWTSDKTYILNGFVFVENGEMLTIEPGTVIKGRPGQAENASALIVAQGGKIYAEGTPAKPIIFTAEADDVNNPNDLPLDTRGLWGGVIMLGKSTINTATGVGQIEGIPSTEPRGAYGGNDDEDNSGVFRYVSIRYGGTNIGEGNEINGLTMAGVGSGTRIEYVEVMNNADDGFEWFGGTANTKYLVSAFNGDDAFDYDEGFRGKGQFWFAIQSDEVGNRGAEQDGGTTPEDGTPYATPQIYNVTYIGSGMNSVNADNDLAMIFRDNAGGKYVNSIFTDFAGNGVEVEDLASGEDSRARLEAGDLVMSNNMWWNFGAGSAITDIATQDFVQTHLGANNNEIVNPQLRGISRTNDAGLDPRPAIGSPALTGAVDPPEGDNYFSKVTYRGAFGPFDMWIDGWTALSQLGVAAIPQSEIVQVSDEDIDGDLVWTARNTYILNGFVFVENDESLTIQPGTVIKGRPGQAENASALIVAQGGQIFANGTKENPIIFTAEADDVENTNDLPFDTRGLWGGLIVLGNASINTATGVGQIEGIPSTEPRGAYGGNDDADNSGVIRYVSIRYGGTNIGEGNEINGLTMAGVGSGTTIEYVEVVNNADDGFEWFGGTVNSKYLISAFNGDDAFDYDEGFRGKGQFWFVLQSDEVGNRGAEQDGGTTPEDGMPYAMPTIYNATYIGSGMNSVNVDNDLALIFRDNAGGKYHNSIFTEFAGSGVEVEDLASGEDSRARLEAGELALVNNIWWNFGAGSTIADIATQDFVQTHLGANNNQIVDPKLMSISHTNNGALDPRPAGDSPAMQSGAMPPNDGFYSQVSYIGAFSSTDNWANGWSYLSTADVLGVQESFDTRIPTTVELEQNYPNPFNPSTTIRFAVPQAGHVRLAVYNMYGQLMDVLVDGMREAGSYDLTWTADNLPSGTYLYTLQTAGKIQTRKMVLVK